MVTLEHPRGSSPEARLARLGFRDVRATAAMLDGLGLTDDPTVPGALARAADPDLALRSLERLVEASAAPRVLLDGLRARAGLRTRLAIVLGCSTVFGDHLARHPEDWRWLDSDAGVASRGRAEVSRATMLTAVGADPSAGIDPPRASEDSPATWDALRVAYRRAQMLTAARDLTGGRDLDEIMSELADLAAAALDAALAVARAGQARSAPPVRLAIIGMGKCGGHELNYVSDVDVVFVAEPGAPGGAAADWEVMAAATRLAEGVVRVCGVMTGEGQLFPVDVGLRPEGRHGPLVRSLASHEAYYLRWARTWEYQALLKARPVAGDVPLGEQYCAAVAPLVWNAASREDFVPDVQAMRQRVEASVPPGNAARELKLGPGGLRDVEFAVQLLQLVHGRTDDTLREPSTLGALAALAGGGYVGRDDAARLRESYRFLRATEHRLQLQHLRRTHSLPRDADGLRWTARAMGFRDAETFEVERARHAREVRRLHEKLFYRPLLEAVARLPAEAARLSPAAARTRLEALGFADPEAALRHLQALTTGVSRTAAIQRTLLPAMLQWFADAPDPDSGLLAYRQVSDALGSTPWYLRLLRDSGTAAERLARILATSTYVAELMARAPESVQLLRSDEELRPRSRAQMSSALLAVVGRNELGTAAVVAARAVRRVELARVACADLLGLLDVSAVGDALSDTAAATVSAALSVALRKLGAGSPPVRLTIIAMGRLGGAELAYSSDADVLFVHEAMPGVSDRSAAGAAHMIAEEVRRLLALPAPDPPLLIDAGLRPEGKQGPLTRSLVSYAGYYRRWSLGWEAQALLRAAPLAGDADLAARFLALADELRYPATLPPGAIEEVLRLKARMQSERMPRGVDRTLHLKLGPGGLTDVEWAVQVLQLRHAHELPALRTTSTLTGLRVASGAGLLAAAEAAVLAGAWTHASRLRNAIMLTSGRPGDVIPRARRPLARVARLAGYPADESETLLEDHRRTGHRTREVVDAVFAREREGT